MRHHEYFVYLLTNQTKSVLYIGCTNNLPQRITEHYLNRGKQQTFAGRYHCHFLVYYERFKYIDKALAREKQIKKWSRSKKEALIDEMNPSREFYNKDLFDVWPPVDGQHRAK